MILKSKLFVAVLAVIFTLSSCSKEEPYDEKAQMAADKELIERFIVDKKLVDVKESGGVYYQVLQEGTGTETVGLNDALSLNYEARLLNGEVVDKTTDKTFEASLSGLIKGWQIGVPFIKQGGRIRLLIPSPLAYGRFKTGPIPANSPLDFTIELVKVTKSSK